MEALAVQFPIFSESSKDHKPMVAMVVILGMETPSIPAVQLSPRYYTYIARPSSMDAHRIKLKSPTPDGSV